PPTVPSHAKRPEGRENAPYPADGLSGERSGDFRHGGVILIGPIPIVWGSDNSMLWAALAAGVMMVMGLVVLLYLVG
ncbi:MAG: DUF131 domain-containing protein, partial [Thermoplasmata archaeon]|nr:DUF131 domain-containing protein [Thermoplasmata archaeon]